MNGNRLHPRILPPGFALLFRALLLGAWLCIQALTAQEPGAAFDQANKLYEQGKYADAITAYEKLLQAGQVSAPLYFNLGNAQFKAGQPGRAVASYLRAERLTPRDPDIQANLNFARASVPGGTTRPGSPWTRWVNRLSLDEWTALASVAASLWLILLAGGQIKRPWRQSLGGYTATTGIMAGLLAVFLGLALEQRFGSKLAVVTVREAVVRFGPLEESQSAFLARDGAELLVTGKKDGWLQVTDGAKRLGWLKESQVLLLD